SLTSFMVTLLLLTCRDSTSIGPVFQSPICLLSNASFDDAAIALAAICDVPLDLIGHFHFGSSPSCQIVGAITKEVVSVAPTDAKEGSRCVEAFHHGVLHEYPATPETHLHIGQAF